MSTVISRLYHSVELVKLWGQTPLPNGQTLSEVFTLNGLPLWDALVVDLARIHIPRALTTDIRPSWLSRLKPRGSYLKHRMIDCFLTKRDTQGCLDWSNGQVFLFLGFGNYLYRDVLHPVVNHLDNLTDISVVTLHDQNQQKINKAILNSHQAIWQHWSKDVADEITAVRKSLALVLRELHKPQVLPDVIRDQGKSIWPQVKDTFTWFFRVYLPLFLPQAVLAQHILTYHRPALVVSPDVADPRTRIYCLCAKQLGIPSLQIQMGAYGVDSIEWRFFVADRLATWGDHSATVMRDHGVSPEAIVNTGSPRFDSLIPMSETEKNKMRTQLGIPHGKPMVLFASVYALKDQATSADIRMLETVKKAIFQAAAKVSGIHMVVKPHPRENVDETKGLAGSQANISFVDPQGDIRELTQVCDAFMALGSTTTLDALILGKLTICPSFPGWNLNDLLFTKSGATLVPHSEDDLIQIFREIAGGNIPSKLEHLASARERFLNQWVFKTDGKASERIAELSKQMALNKS